MAVAPDDGYVIRWWRAMIPVCRVTGDAKAHGRDEVGLRFGMGRGFRHCHMVGTSAALVASEADTPAALAVLPLAAWVVFARVLREEVWRRNR
jgi:hypothetical protein